MAIIQSTTRSRSIHGGRPYAVGFGGKSVTVVTLDVIYQYLTNTVKPCLDAIQTDITAIKADTGTGLPGLINGALVQILGYLRNPVTSTLSGLKRSIDLLRGSNEKKKTGRL